MNYAPLEPEAEEYTVLTGITAELTGFLSYQEQEVFDYTIDSRSFHESLELSTFGGFLADVLRSMDSSRDQYGNTSWRGRVTETEDGANLQAVIEYSSVVDEDELLPRNTFLPSGEYDLDPYEVVTQPLEMKIEGDLSIRYDNADWIT